MTRKTIESNRPGHDGWLLIEAMGNDDRSLLFEGARWKPFSLVHRRSRVHPSPRVTEQLNTIIQQLAHGTRADAVVIEPWQAAGTSGLIVAEPIFGPPADPDLYAVLVWIGTGAPPADSRVVGTMMWNPDNLCTYHSQTTEHHILANSPIRYERTSPEVFKHFRDYPREHALGPWVQSVREGVVGEGETFQDTIEIERSDGVVLNVHLAMRAVLTSEGWRIRGVIHDLSDIEKPTGEQGYSRRTARAFADVLSDANVNVGGLGTVNFATGIILEWIIPPAPPLDSWRDTNATWTDPDLLLEHVQHVADGAPVSKLNTSVSFHNTDRQYPITVTIYPAAQGPTGTGILRIECTE